MWLGPQPNVVSMIFNEQQESQCREWRGRVRGGRERGRSECQGNASNLIISNDIAIFVFFLRQKAKRPTPKNELKKEPKHALTEGRRSPSDAPHRHVKVTRTKDPTTDYPLDPPNREPPPPHQPKDPTKVTTPTYLMYLLQFHSITRRCLQQRICLASQVLSKPWRIAMAKNLLALISLRTRCHAVWTCIRSSSQLRDLTLDSCHCFWLITLSFRSTQMVQSVIPQRKCQILTNLRNLYGILSPKIACFQLNYWGART